MNAERQRAPRRAKGGLTGVDGQQHPAAKRLAGVSKRTCSRLLACRGVTETKRAPPRYSTPFKTNGADADEITLAAVFLTGFFRGFATADDDDGASALFTPGEKIGHLLLQFQPLAGQRPVALLQHLNALRYRRHLLL